MDMGDLSMRRLHPLLQSQLRELRARVTGGRISAHELLEMLSRYYDTVDDERRAMVRSMQLMSDEARSLGVEIAEQGAAQLQVILVHIKDVVITANAEGVIDRANPMAERVFSYPPGELLGLRLDVLVPGIAEDGSIHAGLERLADSSDTFRGVRVSGITARRGVGRCSSPGCSRERVTGAAKFSSSACGHFRAAFRRKRDGEGAPAPARWTTHRRRSRSSSRHQAFHRG
jgi:PAS domain-containing protein